MNSPDPSKGDVGKCIKPFIYKTRYNEWGLRCDDETGDCPEMVNETDGMEVHHYGCECRDCMMFYWSLKH